jgi:hypothetical protein
VDIIDVAGEIWTRATQLRSATQFDLVESVLSIDIDRAINAGDRERAAVACIALGIHLQKCGRIKEARAHLKRGRTLSSHAMVIFESDFYAAKTLSQAGHHNRLPAEYHKLELLLRSGAIELEPGAAANRFETLLWRTGFAEQMEGNVRHAATLFDMHREFARPGSNQTAINSIYGRLVPRLLAGDLHYREILPEAIELTRVYEKIDLATRFTHPQIALIQRDLLRAIDAHMRNDRAGCYEHLWRAGISLKNCGATPLGEGVAELVAIMALTMPITGPLLWAAVNGATAITSFIRNATHEQDLSLALVKAIEAQLETSTPDTGPPNKQPHGSVRPPRTTRSAPPTIFGAT